MRNRRAIRLSITAAAALTLAKVGAAFITGSVAVLSEATHSLTDFVAAAIALIAIRRAAHPPDSKHRYGHEKLENLSAVAEGVIVLVATSYVIANAIDKLVSGSNDVTSPWLAAAVMAVSAITNLYISRMLLRTGAETESTAVTADGHHLMTDVYTSAGAAIGLALVAITGENTIDPIVALLVSALVVRIGIRLIIDAFRVLVDEGLPDEEIALIEHVLNHEFGNEVGYHRLRTRRGGSRRHVDVHLTIDGLLTLNAAHDVAERVEDAICRALPNTDVLTHIEPKSAAPPPGSDIGRGDRL
ncbi:MAG: cation transporter [Thermoleophilia bacterium]|nr:cation transporter [Thermoleophilia bacterium]